MPAGSLQIGGLTPLSSIDYPGHLSAVVFCQGCPWRCGYCHNGELIPRTPRTPGLHWERLVDFLRRRQGLLDAVVFSGGEPTLQSTLADAIRQAKELGFKVGLHTAGPYPERLEQLLPSLDWVALDIKALPEDYEDVTGVPGSGSAAWESARLIANSKIPHEVRTTVHADLIGAEQLTAISEQLARLGITCYRVQRVQSQHCLDSARRVQHVHLTIADLIAPLRQVIADTAMR